MPKPMKVQAGPPVADIMKRDDEEVIPASQQKFNAGLFMCCTDPCILCQVLFCSCLIVGSLAEILPPTSVLYTFNTSCGRFALRNFCLCGWPVNLSSTSFIRDRINMHQGVEEDLCGNLCLHCFCFPCALTQELRYIRDVMHIDVSLC